MTEIICTPAIVGLAVAALLAVGGWLIASSRDKDGLPRTGTTRLGAFLALLGLLAGLLAIPGSLPTTTLPAVLLAVLLGGLALLRAASRQAIGWTALGEVATTAVGLAWARPGRAVVSLLSLVAGLWTAVWVAGQGLPLAALLGALVILAPARWQMLAALARERTRTKVERALAGALAGAEWDPKESARRGAPARVRFDRAHQPASLAFPLPPAWRTTDLERLAAELNARLADWGGPWLLAVAAGSARTRAVCSRGEPLPEHCLAEPTPPDGLRITLGLARISPEAALAGVGEQGAIQPFVWDAADSPSGLIVGSMGGGKSVLVRLIIATWGRFIGAVILLDPKRVEFPIFRGRRGVEIVAVTLAEIAAAFEQAEAEMQRRFALMEAAGVQHVNDLPQPPQPLLIVCDEAFELFSKIPGNDDESKVENVLRATCAAKARTLAALGRAAGVHLILLAQRADAEVVAGSLQNNLLFRALLRPASAGATARNMIGLSEVPVAENPKGRAVMKTAVWPESEVQVAYLDAADLGRWLPMMPEERLRGEGAEAEAATDPDGPKNPDQPPADIPASKPQNDGQVPNEKPGKSKPESGPSVDPESGEDPQQIEWDFMKDFGED